MEHDRLCSQIFEGTIAAPYIRIGESSTFPRMPPLNVAPAPSDCGSMKKDEAPRLLTTHQAAKRLGVSHRTLEDWRFRGGGPQFCKVGRRLVRYRPDDLETFLECSVRINTGGGKPY